MLRRGSMLRWAIAALALGACLWWLGQLDLSGLGRVLGGASWPLVAAAALLNLVQLVFWALRLKVLLAPTAVISAARLYRYLLLAFAVSCLAPMRAGEAVRVWLLRTRERVPVATAIGVAVIEMAASAAALLLCAVPVPWWIQGLPRWLLVAAVLVAGFVAVVGLAAVLLARGGGGRAAGLRQKLALGAEVVRRPRLAAAVLGCSFAIVLVDAAEVLLVARAVGVALPPAGAILVILAVACAAVPSVPAQLGTFEAAAVAALQLLGVPAAPALAFALLYHAMQVVPVTLLGLSGVGLLSARRSPPAGAAAAE